MIKSLISLLLQFVLFIPLSSFSQIESSAGRWKTWVLKSGSELRLPPPPDKMATSREIKTIKELEKRRDPRTLEKIKYWDAGDPGYRWRKLVLELGDGSSTFENSLRARNNLNVAIYDAIVAAWDSKYFYNRQRPSKSSIGIHPVVEILNSPSYPCEHSVVAGTASTLLGYLYPSKKDSLLQLAQEVAQTRVAAGAEFPSDTKAGLKLGKLVADKFIARIKADMVNAVWDSIIPNKPGLWNGTRPLGASMGKWKTWVLDSGSQFRPAPPPDYSKEMEELNKYNRDPHVNWRAYDFVINDHIRDYCERKIYEMHYDINAPRAARVAALMSVALTDASISCRDAKYVYWGIRPHQYDTTFKPSIIITPNFPGYPSAHAALYASAFSVMAYLFPEDSAFLKRQIIDACESRFEAGVHFRTDNEVGMEMGKKVADVVIQWIQKNNVD